MPPRQRKKPESGSKQRESRDEPEEPSTGDTPADEQETTETQQERRRRKKKPRWTPVFKRIGYFCLILLIPVVLNYAALSQENKALMANGGELFDIGWGQKLFMHCVGDGLPTVILEAPLGGSSEVWSLVQPILARHTKVCVYDRAGLGFSDGALQNTTLAGNYSEAAKERDRAKPSTIERMADDLHYLVSYASNQPKPLLLVSSDFSTLLSRFYTQFFDHEVAGIFLIDPAVESLFDKSEQHSGEEAEDGKEEGSPWQHYWYKQLMPHFQSKYLSALLGFNRLALMVGLMSPVEAEDLKLPSGLVTLKKHLLCKPSHLSSSFHEHYFINESMAQLKKLFLVKPFPDHVPVTIATYVSTGSDMSSELTKVWSEGQKRLIHHIHPQCKHIVLQGADDLIFYRNPKAVANAVLSMVQTWRQDHKLAA